MQTPLLSIGIETSSRPGSVALRVGGRDYEEVLEAARASDLLPALDRLRAEAGVPRTSAAPDAPDTQDAPDASGAAALRAVFVGTGPGSYTGLRVGIATASALAHAAQATVLGVPSFDAVAAEGLEPGEAGCVVSDARAGRFYVAAYSKTESAELKIERAPQALHLDALKQTCAEPGVLLVDARSVKSLALERFAPRSLRIAAAPRATTVLRLGEARLMETGAPDQEAADELEPLYLMRFEAKPRKR